VSDFSQVLSVIKDFLVYGFFANLIITVLSELVGDQVRFRIRYAKKKLFKWLRNVNVKVIAIMKPRPLFINEDIDSITKELSALLSSNGIRPFVEGTKIRFEYLVPRVGIGYISLGLNEADGKVNSLELSLEWSIEFQKFADAFLDMTGAMRSLEDMFRKKYSTIASFEEILTCAGLKKAYELNGVLRKYSLENLTTKRGDETEVNFSDRDLTIFGRMDSSMKNLLQDLIAYYY